MNTLLASATARCVCVARHTPRPRELHIHHVWPLGEGGPDTWENRAVLCPTTHAAVHWWLRFLTIDGEGGAARRGNELALFLAIAAYQCSSVRHLADLPALAVETDYTGPLPIHWPPKPGPPRRVLLG